MSEELLHDLNRNRRMLGEEYKHIAALEAENAQLREALRGLMEWVHTLPLDLEIPVPQALAFIAARNKAEAALSPPPTGTLPPPP